MNELRKTIRGVVNGESVEGQPGAAAAANAGGGAAPAAAGSPPNNSPASGGGEGTPPGTGQPAVIDVTKEGGKSGEGGASGVKSPENPGGQPQAGPGPEGRAPFRIPP